MPAPVYVDFIARGTPDISKAFRSVASFAVASEREQVRTLATSTRSKEREYAKLASEAKRWHRKIVTDAEKAVKDEARSLEQSVRARNAIRDRSATMAGQHAKRAATAEIAEQKRVTRSAEQEEKRRASFRSRLRERSATMAGQHAATTARQEQGQANRLANRERNTREHYANAVVGAAGRGVHNAARATYRVGAAAAGMVGQIGGGFSVADAVSGEANLERQAALLSNAAYIPGKTERVSTKDIVSRVKASSIATGQDASDVLEGLNAFTAKTGDYKSGAENLDFFGKTSKSTGASMKDIMRTAGTLKVQNKDLSAEQIKSLTLSTVMQARQGSVEFEDMARAGGKITRTAVSYAGDQGENQRKLLGLAQIGMKASGNDVSESATSLANVSSDALKHRDKVGALLGKDFLNAKGQVAKGPGEFIADVMEKTGGNLAKIADLGFGKQAIKTFQSASGTFNDAEAKVGVGTKEGRAAGKAAVLREQQDITATKYDEGDMQRDFANVMKTSAELFEGAVRSFKTEVGEKLLPEFVKLVPILQKLVPTIQQFLAGLIEVAKWATEHPFAGMAAIITASIAKEIAMAAIGETIKKLLTGGGGGVPVPGGGGAGGGGVPGALGAGALAGAATYLAYKPGVDAVLTGQVRGQTHVGEMLSDMKNGSAAQKEAAAAEFEKAQNEYGGAKGAAKMVLHAGQLPGGLLNELTGGKNIAAEALQRGSQAREIIDNAELKALVTALRENTSATQVNSAAKPAAPAAVGGGTPANTPNQSNNMLFVPRL